MTNKPPRQPTPTQPSPQNPAVTELIAIRQELEQLRKELGTLQKGLVDKVAKGVVIGTLFLAVLIVFFELVLVR